MINFRHETTHRILTRLLPSSARGRSAVLAAVWLLALPLAAQSIHVYPATITATPGTYQSCTGIVDGYNSKSVTWTNSGGALVGINPSTANEPSTIALYTTTPGTYTVTGKSTVNPSLSGTCVITITSSPTPVTTHPRLIITQAMLPGLRAKFAAGSPMATNLKVGTSDYGGEYNYGIMTAAPYSWNWSGYGGGSTPCPSTAQAPAGGTPQNLELVAYNFAILSQIDPTDATYNWKCYGRDVWVYAMTQMLTGAWSGPAEDEWRGQAAGFVYSVDWLIGSGGISTSTDLATSRQWVAWMLRWNAQNGTFFWKPPYTPASSYNSSAMSGNIDQVRELGNNYNEAGFLYFAALPLTFNDNTTDDPLLAGAYNTCGAPRGVMCSDGTAGSMHAYFSYFDGGLLYDEYSNLEDPNVSWQAYQAAYSNLPTQPTCGLWQDMPGSTPTGNVNSCFGEQRGGESAEGSGYGYSVYSVRDAMNAIWTAGYDDPTIYGPQMSLVTSSWWDMRSIVANEFLTGFKVKNGNWQEPVGGVKPAYAYLHTGDGISYNDYPAAHLAEAEMMIFDSYTGRTDRTNTLEWPILNTAFGGTAGTSGGCTGGSANCGINASLGGDSGETLNPYLFIALPAVDPSTLTPPDPRPSMPTDLFNASYNQHLMVRSGFTNTDTLLSYYCDNSLINHEQASCGDFEVYSNNEYITKGRMVFDNDYNVQMTTSTQSNELSITNTCTLGCISVGGNGYQWAASGGLFQQGIQAGLVSLQHAELPAYAAMVGNFTNQYNSFENIFFPTAGYLDVTGASRSMIYLRGSNQVVVYDRAATGAKTNEKASYFNTTGPATITGLQAKWSTTTGAQDAYLTVIRPTTLFGTGGQLVNAPMSTIGGPCSTTPGFSISGDGSLWPPNWQGLGHPLQGIVPNFPGDSYASAPAVTITGCSGPTPVASTVVNSLTAVLNDVTLTQAFENSGDWEVQNGTTLQINDGLTTAAQNLSVLEWGLHPFTPSVYASVTSSAGQSFDGVLLNGGDGPLVMFERAYPVAFSGTTFPASGSTAIYVSDLSPDTNYPITGSGTPSTATTDTAGVLEFAAAGTGNITVGSALPQAATPTFSPPSGSVTNPTVVTASTTTPGCTMYFDTSNPPATVQTTYTVTTGVTLYAQAKSCAGYLDSLVATGLYTIGTPQAGAPSFSPAPGTYGGAQPVTLSSSTSGAGFCSTQDGSTPTESGASCTNGTGANPVTVSVTGVLKAIAYKSGLLDSTVTSGAYTITTPVGSDATLVGIGVAGFGVQ